jgi:HEAT repeat protein
MRKYCNKSLIRVLLLAILAGASPVLMGGEGNRPTAPMAPRTEDQLVHDLESKNAFTVLHALNQLEDRFPSSAKAFSAMKELLKDPRGEVRKKAARVLGAVHADVDQTDIKNICAFLKASDEKEVIDGLKALRGLKAPEAVAEILPLLKHSNTMSFVMPVGLWRCSATKTPSLSSNLC